MKRSELLFSALHVPLDFAMLFVAGTLTYWARFKTEIADIRPIYYELFFTNYLKMVLLIIPFFLIVFALLDLYNTKTNKRFWPDIVKIFIGVSSVFALIIFLAFLNPDFFASRFFVGLGWILAIVMVTFGRFIIRLIQKYLLIKYDLGVHKVVVVGTNKIASDLVNALKSHPWKGFKILKKIPTASYQTLEKIYQTDLIDEIILTDPAKINGDLKELIRFIKDYKVDYKYIPSSLQAKISNIKMDTLLDFPIIEVQKTPLDGWGRILKRFFDILGSLLAIIVFSPVMIITTVLIKLTSKGPVIADIPKRAGLKGRPFKCLKFRSMYVGAHKDQCKVKSDRKGIFKAKNDPRITPVGHFIRKTSIDELPQFFNVLKGEMSMVGPRPHFLNEYQEKHKIVWTIKPGITGLPQISGRSDNTFDEEVKLDTYYIENWSLWLDVIILIKTFFVLLKRREAE